MPRRLSGYTRIERGPAAIGDPKAGITNKIYAAIKGRKFGSWITAGGRSTGYGITDAIENPAYIIESLLRDEQSLGNSEINWQSIDTLGNTSNGRRNGWKFARSIIDENNSLDVIGNICSHAGIVSVHDYANLIRLIALDHYNPALELNNSHVVEEAGKPLVRVRQTHVKYICNEFFLNYKLNYGTGNYDKLFFITASDHNLSDNTRNDKSPLNTYTGLCTQSQSMYNVVQRWTFDADWIRDDATAELFIKTMADWLAIRKWEIEADFWYSEDTLKVEVMDQVLWDLDLLPMSMRNNIVAIGGTEAFTSGGSLADGTYYYVVTAVDSNGETKKSTEVSATISGGGGNGSVMVTWNEVNGAAKYRLYGRASGNQIIYFETIDLEYLDIGASGTSGSPPAVASAFFVTRVIDPGLNGGGRMKIYFMLCPTIFFLVGGYGYGYGEDYGVQL